MLWWTIVMLTHAPFAAGIVNVNTTEWFSTTEPHLLSAAVEPLTHLLPAASIDQVTTLSCNTSQTSTQWVGWLLVLTILFLAQRPPQEARQRAIRIRAKQRSTDS